MARAVSLVTLFLSALTSFGRSRFHTAKARGQERPYSSLYAPCLNASPIDMSHYCTNAAVRTHLLHAGSVVGARLCSAR